MVSGIPMDMPVVVAVNGIDQVPAIPSNVVKEPADSVTTSGVFEKSKSV